MEDTPGGRPRGFGCCNTHQHRHEPVANCNGTNSAPHPKPFAKTCLAFGKLKTTPVPKTDAQPNQYQSFLDGHCRVRLQGADQPTWGQTGRQMLRATAVSRLGVLFSFANAMRCTHGATNLWRNLSVDACRPGAVRNNQIALIPADWGVLPRDRPLFDRMTKPLGAKKQP